jgi:hypothetical protein
MKAIYSVQLEMSAIEAVRTKADDLNVPQGDLLALCLRYAFDRMKPEALRAWAEQQKVPERSKALSADEGRLLRSLVSALREKAPQTRFDAADLQGVCELPVREIYRAALALRDRGWAHVDGSSELDRWGRPAKWYVMLTDEGLKRSGAPDAEERKRLAAEVDAREKAAAAFTADLQARQAARERAKSARPVQPPPPPPVPVAPVASPVAPAPWLTDLFDDPPPAD